MKNASPARHLVPVPSADLSERVRVLAEVIAGLLERVDVLEQQRGFLLAKLDVLERA